MEYCSVMAHCGMECMDNNRLLYERIDQLNLNFPVIFHYNCINRGETFKKHWHEKIEILYFKKGRGDVVCNTKKISVNPGVLVVINSNEMHDVVAISKCVEYYCIIIDNLLFKSLHTDVCETKYINPIYQNQIIFSNRIENDSRANECLEGIIKEFESKETGYELSVKAHIFRLMVLLLRNYIENMLTPRQYSSRVRNLSRINNILQHIEKNYARNISVDELSRIANLSKFYFLRIFKKTTGKSVVDYINYIRINKAEEMLAKKDMNITETAFACGFNDANYFSRLFKKYKGIKPSDVAS